MKPSMTSWLLLRFVVLYARVLCISALVLRESGLNSPTTDVWRHVLPSINETTTDASVMDNTSTARFRVIVLNLDRRPDRLHRITMAMRNKLPGASICRQRSVDGSRKEEIDNVLFNLRIVKTVFEPQAAVACYGSHYYAWERVAQDKSIDFALVVEDDLSLFSNDFQDQFSKLFQKGFWNDKQWVYLQMDSPLWPRENGIRSEQPTELRDMQGLWPKNTAMYAITPSSARSLIQFAKNNYMHITESFDHYVPMTALSTYFAFVPPIAQVAGNDTDIWIPSKSSFVSVEPLSECEAIARHESIPIEHDVLARLAAAAREHALSTASRR